MPRRPCRAARTLLSRCPSRALLPALPSPLLRPRPLLLPPPTTLSPLPHPPPLRQAARGKAEAKAKLLEVQLASCTAASEQLTQRAAENELLQAGQP